MENAIANGEVLHLDKGRSGVLGRQIGVEFPKELYIGTIGGIKYSKRYVDRNVENDYNTDGMRWIYNRDVLSKREQAQFHETMCNIDYRGYRNCAQTADRKYMIPTEHSIVFAEGTYKNPVITSVIRLEVDDPAETIAYIKEVFSDGEWNGYYNEHEAWEAISFMCGEGNVQIFYR